MSRLARPLIARGARQNDRLTLPELRRRMERIALYIRPPVSVRVEMTEVEEVRCEWITPNRRDPRIAVLYLHGGSFCTGSPVTHRHLAGRIARQAGAGILVPDYRLAPEHPFPAPLDDCVACYRHLVDSGFSPERLFIAGDSAGGNLALATMLRLREQGFELPAGAICLSPVVDLARTDEKTRQADLARESMDPMIRRHFVAPMIDKYVAGHNPAAPLLSPLFADLTGLPPLLIQAGGEELLLTDAVNLGERAKADGVEVTLEVYPGMWHVWQVFVPYLPEARRAVAAIGRFLVAHSQSPSLSAAGAGRD